MNQFSHPEDGDSQFLRNIRKFKEHFIQKPKRRPSFDQEPSWKSENLQG